MTDPNSTPLWLGVAAVHKPPGVTSRDVVNRVQRLVRPAKVGHAGTLDPLASGVLLLCLGRATRLIDVLQRMQKHYRGTFLLGRSSPTEDIEGEITLLADPPCPTPEQVSAAAARLVGEIMQRPPAFSALKVAGRRAYDLARAGKTFELAPRRITIHSLSVVAYDYPELTLDVVCSAGTYIRSLGRDLAESLGSAAVMSNLVRTRIGPFDLASAWPPEAICTENADQWLQSPAVATSDLPRIQLSTEEARAIATGQFIAARPGCEGAEEIAAHSDDGRLLAILRPRGAAQYGAKFNLV